MNDLQLSFNYKTSRCPQRPIVLAVDDNEDNLVLISLALKQIVKCSLLTAVDGKTTISLAQQYQPDLILLDIVLPQLNGFEVIYRLKQNPQTKRIPIVAVTALAKREDRDRLIAAGCDGYLSKPYMLEDLETIIDRHLSIPSLV